MLNPYKIRKDFPILHKKINGMPIVYFDNACMSLRPIQVIEAQNQYYNEFPACAGRSNHKLAKRVTEEIIKSRHTIKKFLNSKRDSEIVFTRNTTESINLVANSLGLKTSDEVITTDKEHNSNLLPWQAAVKKREINHTIAEFGNAEDLKKKISKRTRLVSMVHSSNLDGTSIDAKDMREMIKIAHDHGALVMLDGAQSAPHKEIDVRKLDVDFFACSGHKMLGPSGTGILYAKLHILEKMEPFIVGGDTVVDTTYTTAKFEKPPEKFEAGLQNYAGIIGLAAAAKYIMKIGRRNIKKHETRLNERITAGLSDIGGVSIIGPGEAEQRGGIISFNISEKDPHDIALMLDQTANIMIRSGAHCVHSWFNAHKMKGSARASLYLYNTEEECDAFIENLKKIIKII